MNNERAQTCSSCGAQFGCGADRDSCWCSDVQLTAWQTELISDKYDDCLCPSCLAAFGAKAAIKVTYPDGGTEMVEDAVRVDTQNFHEGMFDFYDNKGT